MKKYLIKIICGVTVFFIVGCGSIKKGMKNDERCSLIPDKGICKAAFPKYYFDQEEKKCKQFFWGGCKGVVPFQSLKECEDCKCNKK